MSALRQANGAEYSFRSIAEIPNRSLIEHDVAGSVAPLGAILFIAKRRRETKRAQNGVHLLPVLDTRFQLKPHFMAAGLAFRLVRQHPSLAVLAQPEHFAPLAQLLAGQVVEGIHFVGGAGELFEARLLQRPG